MSIVNDLRIINLIINFPKMVVSFCEIFPFPLSGCILTGFVLVFLSFAAIFLLAWAIGVCFPRKFNYKGRHVLITGGSSGIGLDVAKLYLGQGAKVTIAARNVDNLRKAFESLKGFVREEEGGQLQILSVDVSKSYEHVSEKFSQAVKEFGDIAVLVNSAGISICDEFEKLDPSEYEKMLRVNTLGTMYATRFVIPGMKEMKGGRIVLVSSQVAQVAIYGYTAYAASKWALRGFAEALQMEVKPYNIYVSVCYPPDTDTPGYQVEMTTKLEITKKLSESGAVFSSESVGRDILYYSTRGYFGISTGFDGWLLKQLHPGMSPINSLWEFVQQCYFSGVARLIAFFYLLSWDDEVKKQLKL